LLTEKDEDEYVLSRLCEIMRALLQTHGVDMLPFFHQLQPHILSLLDPQRPFGDFQWGVCFLMDLLEQIGDNEHTLPFKAILEQSMAQGIVHSEADLRQTCAFGIGVVSKVGGAGYVPFLQKMLPQLIIGIEQILTQARNSVVAIPEEEGACYDNMVSAVGKIMRYREADCLNGSINGLTNQTLLPKWLTWLPIRHDGEEVEPVYDYVCLLLASNNPLALERLPHLVYCFAASLSMEVMTTSQDVCKKAMAMVKHVQNNGDMFNQCLQMMSDLEKSSLEKALRETNTT
jgi:hypothetical protein